MNSPDIGEQALSKAAEIGLKSQLDKVENLDVELRANPLDLAQGKLESATIDGKGMVMKQELRAERLVLQTDNIAINSFKAAFGDIELTQTTNAESKIVLLEEDIQRAFNSKYIKNKLKDYEINLNNGESVIINARNVKFALPGNNRFSLTADVDIKNKITRKITFSARPCVNENGQKIILQDVEYQNYQEFSFELVEALLDITKEVLDLRNFELNQVSLQIQRLDISPGKMIVAARASIQDFPG